MAHCPNCGEVVSPSDSFCEECGFNLQQRQSFPKQPAAEPSFQLPPSPSSRKTLRWVVCAVVGALLLSAMCAAFVSLRLLGQREPDIVERQGTVAAEGAESVKDIGNRPGLAGIALTADSVVLTQIAHEYGYHRIFARQVEALVKPGDIVVGVCTNGLATNVLDGVRAAKTKGARTVALTGGDGGQLAAMVDEAIVIPSTDIARVREAHIVIAHIVCQLLQHQLCYQSE